MNPAIDPVISARAADAAVAIADRFCARDRGEAPGARMLAVSYQDLCNILAVAFALGLEEGQERRS